MGWIGIRIIVSWPSHPLYFMVYLFILLPLLIIAPGIYSYLFTFTGMPRLPAIILGSTLVLLSLTLSFVNIVLKEISTGPPRITLRTRYIYFLGMYFPVISPEITYNRLIIAVNAGGAIIPVGLSLVLLGYLSMVPRMLLASTIGILVTSIVTYYSSRSIPGVGIAVPGFIPSITAVLITIILVQNPVYGVPIAYVSGTLGSLIGADVLRLMRDIRIFLESGSSLLSIGGAGTFDGVFLSGLFAVLWVLLLAP